MGSNKKLVVIAGPTAVGKTACAVQLARHYRTEIINADSRQIFKGLDIGTAKPSAKERNLVKHHFVDYLEIDQEYTAGRFEQEVDELLRKLFLKNEIVVLTGGTGFYIDAVIKGLDDIPTAEPKIRNELMNAYEKHGLTYLLEELKDRDLDTYNSIDRSNPHRIVRALEVIRSTGKTYSSFKNSKKVKQHDFKIIKIALELPRTELYDRINQRVDRMMEEGLLEEVTRYKIFRKKQALQTVGYKELFEYLDGTTSIEDAIDLVKRNSRRYAKRQLTWLKRDSEYYWVTPNIDDILKIVESN